MIRCCVICKIGAIFNCFVFYASPAGYEPGTGGTYEAVSQLKFKDNCRSEGRKSGLPEKT